MASPARKPSSQAAPATASAPLESDRERRRPASSVSMRPPSSSSRRPGRRSCRGRRAGRPRRRARRPSGRADRRRRAWRGRAGRSRRGVRTWTAASSSRRRDGGGQADARPGRRCHAEPRGPARCRRGGRCRSAAPGQRLDGGHEALGVVLAGGAVGEGGHHGGEGVGQLGEQRVLDQPGELGDVGVGRPLGDHRGRGRFDGGAVPEASMRATAARVPLQRPRLLEGATGAAGVDAAAPRDAEQPQPVEQLAARPAAVGAEVEGDGAARRPTASAAAASAGARGRGPAAPSACRRGRRRGRRRRGAGRRRASGSGEPPMRTASVASVSSARPARGRPRRVARASARRTASITDADDASSCSSRSRRGGAGEPAGDDVAGGGEQVLVPARRGDPGAVAAGEGEAAVGPRHPRGGHLTLGRPLSSSASCLAVGNVVGSQGGGVPGAADERRRCPCAFDGGPDRRRMAASRRSFGWPRPARAASARSSAMASSTASNTSSPWWRCSTASSHHRSGSSKPAVRASTAIGSADRRVPAALVVASALAARSAEHWWRRGGRRSERAAVLERPPERHPLGRERGQGVEGGPAGFVGGVDEAGDRRPHAGAAASVSDGVELRRALDQDDVGPHLVEAKRHRPGQPRPVVPDPEDVDRRHGRPRSPSLALATLAGGLRPRRAIALDRSTRRGRAWPYRCRAAPPAHEARRDDRGGGRSHLDGTSPAQRLVRCRSRCRAIIGFAQ